LGQKEGGITAAVHALREGTAPVPITGEVLEQMKELHPQGPDATVLSAIAFNHFRSISPNNPNNPLNTVTITPKQVEQLVTTAAKKRSSAGPSGMTAMHISPLLCSTVCLYGLALLLSAVANGLLPQRLKEYLLPSRLLALTKPNQPGKVRPIAVPEVLYRLAATHVAALAREELGNDLLPLQYGTGASAGCERVIHHLSRLLLNKDKPSRQGENAELHPLQSQSLSYPPPGCLGIR
jgi:hypothetical protein